jgi:prophage antirepressor-like protein
MSSILLPFAFEDHLIRVLRDENGEPLFVAKDVARALGYEWNGMKNIQHVPEEWRGVESVSTPSGEQQMLTLSEQGLYFFLARSDKPRALPFQKWLAGEVLPSLRKTGSYTLPGRGTDALPEGVPRLKPSLRERVLDDAIQTARMVGAASMAEVEAIFARYCALVGVTQGSLSDEARDFYNECCQYAPGRRETLAALYEAFRRWRGKSSGPLPP